MSLSPGEEVAAPHLGAVLIRLLRNSRVPVPHVRKAALIESCRFAPNQESIQGIVLDSFTGSPYIPDTMKNRIVESVITGQWRELHDLEQQLSKETTSFASRMLPQRRSPKVSPQKVFLEFQEMARSILKTSRKVQRGLVLEKKKTLFEAIRQSTNKEELIETLLQALMHAKTMDDNARQLIANDVLDGNFHRLPLPDRFDCCEKPRISIPSHDTVACHGTEQPNLRLDEECPICLDPYSSVREQPNFHCCHTFCQDCVTGWINSGFQMDCPICRASLRRADVYRT